MNPSTFLDPRFPMSLRERCNRLGEWAVLTLAWKLPRRLVYWTVVRAAVSVAGNGHPGEVKSLDMLKGFEERHAHRR
jgi:hypothetical protein